MTHWTLAQQMENHGNNTGILLRIAKWPPRLLTTISRNKGDVRTNSLDLKKSRFFFSLFIIFHVIFDVEQSHHNVSGKTSTLLAKLLKLNRVFNDFYCWLWLNSHIFLNFKIAASGFHIGRSKHLENYIS